jgi:hypothetical protein
MGFRDHAKVRHPILPLSSLCIVCAQDQAGSAGLSSAARFRW